MIFSQNVRKWLFAAIALTLSNSALAQQTPVIPNTLTSNATIAESYVAIAHQLYSDSLTTASSMAGAIEEFLDAPTEENFSTAKAAWREARRIYSQTEVFRFSNPVVDDWEVQVNAWPLDEGYIDYVDGDNYFYELGNPVGKANIIASTELRWGPNELDLSEITPELLASLNELGGTEANVATGWHAIEFLLWGQDLNDTLPGAGQRPVSDYLSGEACTNGSCERRAEYLQAATDLVIEDLEYIVAVWDTEKDGSYAQEFLAFNADEQLRRILYGMGSLALGELAGERMKVALLANSPEDEHDCFSDDTHSTLYNNALGIIQILRGTYTNLSGDNIGGASLLDWANENQEALGTSLDQGASTVLNRLSIIVDAANQGETFDQLIAPGNTGGADIINQTIDALIILTRDLELLAGAMGLETLNPDNAGHSF